MADFKVKRIDKVTATVGKWEPPVQYGNPFQSNFYLVVTKVTAEFNHDDCTLGGLRTFTVYGMRWRMLKAGPKRVGDGRRRPEEPTVWGPLPPNLARELRPLLEQMSDSRKDGANSG